MNTLASYFRASLLHALLLLVATCLVMSESHAQTALPWCDEVIVKLTATSPLPQPSRIQIVQNVGGNPVVTLGPGVTPLIVSDGADVTSAWLWDRGIPFVPDVVRRESWNGICYDIYWTTETNTSVVPNCTRRVLVIDEVLCDIECCNGFFVNAVPVSFPSNHVYGGCCGWDIRVSYWASESCLVASYTLSQLTGQGGVIEDVTLPTPTRDIVDMLVGQAILCPHPGDPIPTGMFRIELKDANGNVICSKDITLECHRWF